MRKPGSSRSEQSGRLSIRFRPKNPIGILNKFGHDSGDLSQCSAFGVCGRPNMPGGYEAPKGRAGRGCTSPNCCALLLRCLFYGDTSDIQTVDCICEMRVLFCAYPLAFFGSFVFSMKNRRFGNWDFFFTSVVVSFFFIHCSLYV